MSLAFGNQDLRCWMAVLKIRKMRSATPQQPSSNSSASRDRVESAYLELAGEVSDLVNQDLLFSTRDEHVLDWDVVPPAARGTVRLTVVVGLSVSQVGGTPSERSGGGEHVKELVVLPRGRRDVESCPGADQDGAQERFRDGDLWGRGVGVRVGKVAEEGGGQVAPSGVASNEDCRRRAGP